MKAPFPYFGGKRRAAPLIWKALGDPGGYIEPFCGSAATLLARPGFKGRRVETLNDADGWLVNAWRAIQQSPDEVAMHAGGPVTEIDYHARLAWLQERRGQWLVSWLEGDPENHDARAAGWWLYVMAAAIGAPFASGPWRVIDGKLQDTRALPHLGNAGKGVNRELPHLGDAGKGVNRAHGLAAYMRQLSERLARVRITCGDWQRVLTPSVLRAKTGGDGSIAVLLDPPYAVSGDLYHEGDATGQISGQVREWCATVPADLRVVLCGYEAEHDELLGHGWTVIHGKAGGGAGYSADRDAGKRERLWLSPACIQTGQGVLL